MAESPIPTPMFGSCRGLVEAVRGVSIHGDLYHDVQIQREDAAGVSVVRVPSHVCSRPPAAGDRVELQFLMGQASGMRHLEEPTGSG